MGWTWILSASFLYSLHCYWGQRSRCCNVNDLFIVPGVIDHAEELSQHVEFSDLWGFLLTQWTQDSWVFKIFSSFLLFCINIILIHLNIYNYSLFKLYLDLYNLFKVVPLGSNPTANSVLDVWKCVVLNRSCCFFFFFFCGSACQKFWGSPPSTVLLLLIKRLLSPTATESQRSSPESSPRSKHTAL